MRGRLLHYVTHDQTPQAHITLFLFRPPDQQELSPRGLFTTSNTARRNLHEGQMPSGVYKQECLRIYVSHVKLQRNLGLLICSKRV